MYQMKKGGSSKSSKQQAAIAMSMKVAGKKPKKMAKGGSTSFGMLSVKKGIDNNPAPTQADRIAGATMKKGSSVKKMKMGGSCGTPKSLRKAK